MVISVQPRGCETPQPAFSTDGSQMVFVDETNTMTTGSTKGRSGEGGRDGIGQGS